MSESADVQLQLKKKARRRLIGAIAFAGLAAVVLPMVMDEEPKQQIQAVQIRIPGQDQPPLLARTDPVAEPVDDAPSTVPSPPPIAPAKPGSVPPPNTGEKPVSIPPEKKPEKQSEKSEKPQDKPEKLVEKPQEKPAEKPADKPAPKAADDEARRVQAILSGKNDAVASAGDGQQFVILIGAYANQANVKNLQKKLSEMGVRAYTEPLESPQGVKTRVRAGPFPSRDAAEKALAKMKRIGVDGTISTKS